MLRVSDELMTWAAREEVVRGGGIRVKGFENERTQHTHTHAHTRTQTYTQSPQRPSSSSSSSSKNHNNNHNGATATARTEERLKADVGKADQGEDLVDLELALVDP